MRECIVIDSPLNEDDSARGQYKVVIPKIEQTFSSFTEAFEAGMRKLQENKAASISLRERLAYLQHSQWSGWMHYLFSKGTLFMDGSFSIHADSVLRWKRQMNTDYSDLPESEKESDRVEADKYLPIIKEEVEKKTRRLQKALLDVAETLRVPAAEYVPAISDAWQIINEALEIEKTV